MSNKMTDAQYEEANDYLKTCESVYSDIGMPGIFVMGMLSTYRRLIDGGDRSISLYEDIMEVEL